MPVFLTRALLALPLVIVLVGCAGAHVPQADARNRTGCVDEYDPATDYFPDKVSIDHATGLDVSYGNHTKLVEIARPWQDAAEPRRVLLVQCGTPVPDGAGADVVVEVPVRRAATFSTTQLPAFALLDQVDAVVAHGGLDYVSTPEVVAAAESGAVREVGDQTDVDTEALLAVDPDVALLSAGLDGDAYRSAVERVGVAAVPYADWLEETPLGRAEWLKLVATLTNTERRAGKVFGEVEESVAEVTRRAERIDVRPEVLVGAPYEGTWFVPAGDSYVANALAAVGARYPWADTGGTGSLPLDLEAVIDRAADADVWIGVGSVGSTLEDFAGRDERFRAFRALREGRVYADDLRTNDGGGNALYELGAVRPDLVLADFFKLLHPEEAEDVEFTFYGPVGAQAGAPAS